MPIVKSRDGTLIGYEAVGSGPALILVDGAMCYRDSGPMRPLAGALQDRFTVYTFDRRGRGESGDTTPYAVDREVEDIEALLDAAGGTAFVYGCSSGGALALEAANRLPGITRLMIYEAPFILDASRDPVTDDKIWMLHDHIAAGRNSDAVKLFMKFVGMPGLMLAVMPLLMGRVWKKLTGIAHTLAYDFELVTPYQRGKPIPADAWRDVSAKVLVADGGKSPAWMRNAQAALARHLGAGYRTLEGQTHMVKPEAQVPLIREFFA